MPAPADSGDHDLTWTANPGALSNGGHYPSIPGSDGGHDPSIPGSDGGHDPSIPGPEPISAGRYTLGDEIARGGMGVVYRATDTAFGREVAIKVLQVKYDPTSGAGRRFAEEARITGQLQHPAIPPVHDLGTLPDGRPFLAMKLIKGQTLDDLLKARTDLAADRGRFVAAFEAVCQAVAYAHAHKVIHRDLKPANIMVGSFGEVQVMDWGLAKVLASGGRQPSESESDETPDATEIRSPRDSDSDHTQSGSVLGTPAFMPPEQAIGAVELIDERSDVFGLGAILCMILTGKPPYIGITSETTRQMAAQGLISDAFARLDASGAEPELVSLCKRCLDAAIENRPASAEAVATAVATLRADADERARVAELNRVKGIEGRKRRRVQGVLALSVVVLLGVTAFGATVASLWQKAEGAKESAQDAEGRAVAARDAETIARTAAEKAQFNEAEARKAVVLEREKLAVFEYGRTMQVAHQELRENNIVAANALIEGTRKDLRGWEWHYLHRLCHSDLLTLQGHTGYVRSASFSSDGSRIVTGSSDKTAKVWDAKTGAEVLTLKGHTEGFWPASFSQDGTRILTGSADGTARIWDSRPISREFLPKQALPSK